MTIAHIFFSTTTPYGSKLRLALDQFELGLSNIEHLRDCMTLMINGDGSASNQFGEVTSRFGFPDDATSQSAWNELNSALSKLTTDATVDHVNAAVQQLLNKLR